MGQFNIVMPKMGESVQEATITRWFVSVGDKIEEDDVLVEIATDKVDSEIPSPVEGNVLEIKFQEGDVVAVGEVIAVISVNGDTGATIAETGHAESLQEEKKDMASETIASEIQPVQEDVKIDEINKMSKRFYSPLVKNIAKQENISFEELEKIKGTGKEGRVKKEDILNYVEQKRGMRPRTEEEKPVTGPRAAAPQTGQNLSSSFNDAPHFTQ